MTFRKLNILIVIVSLMSGVVFATDVTYQVMMSFQQDLGNFDLDAGDIVVVRGDMNNWAGEDYTLEAVENDDTLLMQGTFDLDAGNHSYHYVIVHQNGADDGELNEILDQNYENWAGGSIDEEFFRSEPSSLRCETNRQFIDSPNFSVVEGNSYLINFWHFDAEGADGHHAEYYFYDGDGSELRHSWVRADQDQNWRKLTYLVTSTATGASAKLRLTTDDDETFNFDDISVNDTRDFQLGDEAVQLNPIWFDDEEPPARAAVTFHVNMGYQAQLETFNPEEGDIVVVRGNMNNWGGEEFVLDAVEGNENLLMTGTFIFEEGDYDYHFAIIHEDRAEEVEINEVLDQNYENWQGGSVDNDVFRSEPNSLKCETDRQLVDSPNFAVEQGNSYLLNFWFFDREDAAGHNAEYYFYDGNGSVLRHSWVGAVQGENWQKLSYMVTSAVTGDVAKIRLTPDDNETFNFDDMSVNDVRDFRVIENAVDLDQVWFNDIEPPGFSSVTFQVKMEYQARLGNFDPDAGDIVVVRGAMNDWTGEDYTLNAIPNNEELLMMGTFLMEEGDQDFYYVIVHQDGEDDIESNELLDQNYENWQGGSIDNEIFRTEPNSRKCETSGQITNSPSISVVAGNSYLITFWIFDAEGSDGHNAEYYFIDGDGSELRHSWVSINQAENWRKLTYMVTSAATGDEARLRLTPDDNETINFDDMSVNDIRDFLLENDPLTLNPVWFDDVAPPPTFPVTFQVMLDFQDQLGIFQPENGDMVVIQGTMNNYSGNEYPLHPIGGDENQLMRATYNFEFGNYDYHYVIVRQDGKEIVELNEIIDQDLRQWRGGATLDTDIFRSLSYSRKCETNDQRAVSPSFSVTAGESYLLNFWYLDFEGEAGHNAEYDFRDGNGSELRHSWSGFNQAGNWLNTKYVVKSTVSGNLAKLILEPDDNETIYFDDMSVNDLRDLVVGEEGVVIDPVWFNDRERVEIANVDVLFQVNMSVAIESGMFDPDSDAVIIRGAHEYLGNWGGFHSLRRIGQSNSYATWIQFENAPLDSAIEFKFAIDTSNGQSESVLYEEIPRGGNRKVARSGMEEDQDNNGYFEVMPNIVFWNDNPGILAQDVTLHLKLNTYTAFAKFADTGIAGIDTIRGFWVAGFGSVVGWNWGDLPDEARMNDEGVAPDQNADDMIYGISILFPAMSPKRQGYQYGINMQNNEAMIDQNHVIMLNDDEAEMTKHDVFGETGDLYDNYLSVQPIDGVELPTKFEVSQNFPNPFNGKTAISFSLNIPSEVLIKVYDLTGAEVMVHQAGKLSAGSYSISVDFATLSSGTYIYRVEAGEFSASKKMMLLK